MIAMLPAEIEVITLFVDKIDDARSFYRKVFAADVVYQDPVCSVLNFSGAMINLLEATQRRSWSNHRPWPHPVPVRASC